MSASSGKKRVNAFTNKTSESTDFETKEANVLYQRLGDRWYAFSVIEDEVYMGAISEADLANPKETKSGR
jgi:hypothetical protein